MQTKRRRILRKLKITEISGVDRPCIEGALVTIMKRAAPPETTFQQRAALLEYTSELVSKYNANHDQRGRFATGSGGGSTTAPSGTSSSSDGGSEITQAHKDETLRWIQIAARTAKIASWALVVPAMVAAFTAAAPVSRPNASAINKAREATADFDKIVSDLKAAGMTGTQALSKARQDYPDEFAAFQFQEAT